MNVALVIVLILSAAAIGELRHRYNKTQLSNKNKEDGTH
ncbi:hypothetical protein HCH_03172 [Hahella chejuensis KCTC 2396]|uniref:Uncharacterized protein n=1 Tax=Hahella chejuensis (strain KCTC 2396) TaxID=349521 RepID=Q2SHD9_HAHCH|nr:hypothetical protein HCH_03172 [Hahella chejuensis KCTC 2396]